MPTIAPRRAGSGTGVAIGDDGSDSGVLTAVGLALAVGWFFGALTDGLTVAPAMMSDRGVREPTVDGVDDEASGMV
ncbi:hypothetical protein ABZS66_60095 [Dactylosporangium sp. NPDC005572]|uniref:hypothetical protein n=1 Tax=Dactylosporangium sp. NPDC005572 TaxID=3156889 RepID=UPI0033B8BD60